MKYDRFDVFDKKTPFKICFVLSVHKNKKKTSPQSNCKIERLQYRSKLIWAHEKTKIGNIKATTIKLDHNQNPKLFLPISLLSICVGEESVQGR